MNNLSTWSATVLKNGKFLLYSQTPVSRRWCQIPKARNMSTAQLVLKSNENFRFLKAKTRVCLYKSDLKKCKNARRNHKQEIESAKMFHSRRRNKEAQIHNGVPFQM